MMKLMINETSYSGLDYWRTDSHLNPRHTVVAAENRSGFANQRWSQLCVPVLNWASRLTKNEERIETSTAAHLYQKTVALCVCVWKSKKNALQTDKNVNVKCVWLCICVDLRWWERKEREKICRHATKVDWGSQRSQAAAVTDTQKMRQSDSCSQFTGSAIASHSSDFYCHPSSLGSARQEH